MHICDALTTKIRAEVIGGLVNGVFLIAVCFFIILEAIQRFIEPPGK